jgi:glycosyltransferase involved in cell wall biosynthesis
LAEKVLGLRPDLFTVIPNGVADDPTLRATAWNGEGEFRVGHVGSITERKGWRIGAEAVLQLAAEGIRVRYVIAGNGPEAGQAEALGRKHPNVIEYLGHVPQPRRNLLPKLHVLSVMSAHEGLPMTIIEAMSAGVPVVATAVGGIPEAVVDGQTGFLIPRSVEELAKKLRCTYASLEIWRTMSHHTRERFKRQFEISHIVKQYDAVYSQAFSS